MSRECDELYYSDDKLTLITTLAELQPKSVPLSHDEFSLISTIRLRELYHKGVKSLWFFNVE